MKLSISTASTGRLCIFNGTSVSLGIIQKLLSKCRKKVPHFTLDSNFQGLRRNLILGWVAINISAMDVAIAIGIVSSSFLDHLWYKSRTVVKSVIRPSLIRWIFHDSLCEIFVLLTRIFWSLKKEKLTSYLAYMVDPTYETTRKHPGLGRVVFLDFL